MNNIKDGVEYSVKVEIRGSWHTAWHNFRNAIEDDNFNNNATDELLLREHNCYNPSWQHSQIYFKTEEDALAFMLKFS